ncbi:MAG TPA: hypothetical protein EYP35_00110 [Desulfobacterales bacterium]|nr:hypothetical protein [Desulfobacterales bacterium]HIP39981.1 hypothetical protein [Desulfocapsa sulfexigens]
MNGKFWGNITLSIVIFALVAFAVSKISASTSGVASVLLPDVTVSDSVKDSLQSIVLSRSSITIQKAGNMVDASFTIENKGKHDIKNISILCTLFDVKGKEQGRDKWIVFDTVKAQNHGVFTFSDKMFISDSIVRSDCEIVGLQPVKEPLIKVHRTAAVGHGTTDQKSGHSSQH